MPHAFIQFEGTTGECTDDKHKGAEGWTQVQSWGWGMSSAITDPSATTSRAASKAMIQDFSISKYVDFQSAALMQGLVTGKHWPKVIFQVCQEAGEKHTFIQITFTDVMISAISPGGGGYDRPVESMMLNFAAYEFNYWAVDDKGKRNESKQVSSWSQAQNKATAG